MLPRSPDGEGRYNVIYTEPFQDEWQTALEQGYLGQIDATRALLALRRRLEQTPYLTGPKSGMPANRRVFPISRDVEVWYTVVEDDRLVYMEAVVIISAGD